MTELQNGESAAAAVTVTIACCVYLHLFGAFAIIVNWTLLMGVWCTNNSAPINGT